MNTNIPGGLVHSLPADLAIALAQEQAATTCWEHISAIARNEYICWIEAAKQPTTRERRINRTIVGLLEGKKRPCCWAGCVHRQDKKPSRWQNEVLIQQKVNRL